MYRRGQSQDREKRCLRGRTAIAVNGVGDGQFNVLMEDGNDGNYSETIKSFPGSSIHFNVSDYFVSAVFRRLPLSKARTA